MPPQTRAAKRKAVQCDTQFNTKRRCVKAFLDPNVLEQCLNDVDPITHDPVSELTKCNAFLHAIDEKHFHVYNAHKLFEYVETTNCQVSPLTRTIFTDEDLRKLATMNGKHPHYLIARMKLQKWKAFLPSTTVELESQTETLWMYTELLVLLSQEHNAMKFYDMTMLLLFPWIWSTCDKIHQSGLDVVDVLHTICSRLECMLNSDYKRRVLTFFETLCNKYTEDEE